MTAISTIIHKPTFAIIHNGDSENHVRDLISEYQTTGSNDSAKELTDLFHSFIAGKAYGYINNEAGVTQDELVQAGNLALLDKAKKFDFRRTKFLTYAGSRITGAMIDEIRERMKQAYGLSRGDQTILHKMKIKTRDQSQLKSKDLSELVSDDIVYEFAEGKVKPDVKDRVKALRKERVRLRGILNLRGQLSLSSSRYESDNGEKVELIKDLTGESNLNLSPINDCPLKDCRFPTSDHMIYQLGGLLNQEEMIILDLYYGFTSPDHKKTMKEIGELLNLSESRVSQKFSELKSRLKSQRLTLSSGIPPEHLSRELSDPLFKLLASNSCHLKIDFSQNDYKFISHALELLPKEDRRKIKQIRGGESEYSLPPNNQRLQEVWELSEDEVLKTKRSLSAKLLWVIDAKRNSDKKIINTNGWILSPTSITNHFQLIDSEDLRPEDVVKELAPLLGYKAPNDDISLLNNIKRDELIELVENPETERIPNRKSAMEIAHAIFTEPKESFFGKIFRLYPVTVELLLERLADYHNIIILQKLKKLQETRSANYNDLHSIFEQVTSIKPEEDTIRNFISDFNINLQEMEIKK